jgi:large subunit ribosomal protein L24
MSARGKLVSMLMKGGHPRRKQNKPQIMEAAKKTKWNILRGDQVQVISRAHPEFGKQGIVLKVDRARDRVIVENVNMGTKNAKADPDRGRAGRTIYKERSLHYSNVNLVDPVTGHPTRVFRKFLEDGTKVRVAKKSGAIIPRPEILSARKRPKPMGVTESDTSVDEDVWAVTYNPDDDFVLYS